MSAANEIEEMQKLLAERERWTQRRDARDSKGEAAHPQGENATCWCVSGAAQKVGLSDEGWNCLYDAAQELYQKGPVEVNDLIGFEAVHIILARAKVLAEKK